MRLLALVVAVVLVGCETVAPQAEYTDATDMGPDAELAELDAGPAPGPDAACVPETGVDWCKRLSVACDETLTFDDNCGIQHTIVCHNCPDAALEGVDSSVIPLQDAQLDAQLAQLDAGAGPDAEMPGKDADLPGLDAAPGPGLDASSPPGLDAAQPGVDAAPPGRDAATVNPCDTMNCNDGNDCTSDTCSNATCHNTPVGYNAPCWSGGKQGACTGITCCTGCTSSTGQCFPGNVVEACGRVNETCKSCDDNDPCTADTCDATSTCRHTYAGDYASCGSSSLCYNRNCIACGGVGQPCCPGSTCSALGSYCDTGFGSWLTGTCKACGGHNETCCPGHACGSGLNCENYTATVEGFCKCGWDLYSDCCSDRTCDGVYPGGTKYTCGSCGGGKDCCY